MSKINKVVLAYSGGLDTSVIVKWLQETYDCEVVTYTADLGQGEEVEPARAKAEALGVKEIYIEELPPNESLSISIFNTDETFQVDQVLIGDQLVTSTMNKLAEFKRIPSFKWNFLFITMTIFLSLSAVGYSFYSMNKSSETNQLIAKAYKNLGYMKCQPFEFDNAIGNEKKLERKYQQLSKTQQQNTLILNNVSTYEKLKVKDDILFCLPKKF